ncbi:Uncharacterised protein [Mycobacteroides abscessus subsp. abscessus]|nr:Uncharacterised protein [Mycobacteroides abscessus subsp. abscessus]
MLPDEIGTVYFADILALEKAQATIDLGDHAGDGGLTGAGRTREHQVMRAVTDGEPAVLTAQRHCHRTLESGDLVLDLFQTDELAELLLGLGQQDRLALMGLGIDEILFAGFGFGVPGVGASGDAGGGRGVQSYARIGERMLDLGVLRIGGIQILKHLGSGLLVTVVAQIQSLGESTIGRRHFDWATGVFEVGQCRIDHAELGERDAQGDPHRMGCRGVQRLIGDHGSQQRDHIGPPLGPVLHGDGDPPGVEPPRAPRGHGGDQLVGLVVLTLVHECRRVSGSQGSVRAAMRAEVVVCSPTLGSVSACSISAFSGLAAYRS